MADLHIHSNPVTEFFKFPKKGFKNNNFFKSKIDNRLVCTRLGLFCSQEPESD